MLQKTLVSTAQTKFLARRRQDIDALFLLGDNSNFMTGQTLNVDGGQAFH